MSPTKRGHADREVDQEQLPEELRQPVPPGISGDDPGGLHRRDERSQADRQRDEDEVVDGGDTELPPRNIQDIHAPLPGLDSLYDEL